MPVFQQRKWKESKTTFKVWVFLCLMLWEARLRRWDEDREDRCIIEHELWGFSPFCNTKHDDKLRLKWCWNKQYALCGNSSDWSMALLSSWSHERSTSAASQTDECSISDRKPSEASTGSYRGGNKRDVQLNYKDGRVDRNVCRKVIQSAASRI